MAAIDESDSPIRGFDIIHHPDGNYLRCRGRDCKLFRKVRRHLHLEQLLALAAEHREQCTAPIQVAHTAPKLPFIVTPDRDTIQEQDPRYNLVQDLVEGDAERQDWAADMLRQMRFMSLAARVEFVAKNPFEKRIVAYRVRGMWYCIPHKPMFDAEPVRADNMVDEYAYYCDVCSKLIRKALV